MENAQIAKPVMNPRTMAAGETEAGFETKYPMMTAKPIIAQLMGLSIEIEALRLKVAAPAREPLLAEFRLGHSVVDDLSPALDDSDDRLLAHPDDLLH